jgi:hypothetical protein
MTSPKLILFNGPRHSGKDTAALYCASRFNAYHFKMSRPLKDGIKVFFNLSDEEVDYLESIKTEPSFLLFGSSYVNVQISLSEEWAKKKFGPFVFGNLAANLIRAEIKKSPNQELYVCSDSGFMTEALPVIDLFGKKNTLLVKIHREGKDFSGDSRSYIDLNGVQTIDIENNGNVEEYHQTLDDLVSVWAYDSKADIV